MSRPRKQIDQRTWLERLHDFKAHLWWLVRHFFRGQFTDDARDTFREEQGKLGKKSRVVGAAQFAQVPILNASQLVARWKLETPPALVSETQQLPIDGLGVGRVLDRSDGRHVQGLHRGARHEHRDGGADAERHGRALRGRPQDRRADGEGRRGAVGRWQMQSSGTTDGDGMASLTMTVRGADRVRQVAHAPDNVWILARHGADAALVTPWSYGFTQQNQPRRWRISTRTVPVYRPGHTVHIKAIVRLKKDDTLQLPQGGRRRCR